MSDITASNSKEILQSVIKDYITFCQEYKNALLIYTIKETELNKYIKILSFILKVYFEQTHYVKRSYDVNQYLAGIQAVFNKINIDIQKIKNNKIAKQQTKSTKQDISNQNNINNDIKQKTQKQKISTKVKIKMTILSGFGRFIRFQ